MEMDMTNLINNVWPKFLDAGLNMVWAVILLMIGIKVINVARKLLRSALERSSIDIGVVQFMDAVLILALLGHFGVQTTSFITILGSAGVAIGLSLQGSLSNFAGGILILVLKPFVVGDYVSACGCEGTVAVISLFYTTLHTVDNRNVVLPNGSLSNSNITNYSANEIRRVDMSVDVGYGSDLKRAREVIMDILNQDERILKDPAPVVAVDNLGDSGVNVVIRPWVKCEDYWDVKWSILEAVHDRLNAEQIDIPFPQMTVHLDQNL